MSIKKFVKNDKTRLEPYQFQMLQEIYEDKDLVRLRSELDYCVTSARYAIDDAFSYLEMADKLVLVLDRIIKDGRDLRTDDDESECC